MVSIMRLLSYQGLLLVFLMSCLLISFFAATAIAQESTLNEQERERVRNLAANVANKSEATSDRLRQIIARMHKHTDIMQTEDGEYQEVGSYSAGILEQQEAVLDKIDADILKTDEFITTVVTAPEPKEQWEVYSPEFYRVASLLREVHTELLKVLVYLKNPEGQTITNGQLVPENASTTNSGVETATSTTATTTSTNAAVDNASSSPTQ